ncbi:hypothetical protein TNCV_1552821 [Trichonephila clavipes]|nr:hypothetical protein TNCV_1552821 [Trichonephila clavipes]
MTPELETPSPYFHTTPTGGRLSLARLFVHRPFTWQENSKRGCRDVLRLLEALEHYAKTDSRTRRCPFYGLGPVDMAQFAHALRRPCGDEYY